MKLLVATGEVRTPDGDFNWCDENEPLLLPVGVCDSGETCGCAHSWVGVNTSRGTTFAKVAEVDITIRRFQEQIRDRLVGMGYIPKGRSISCSNVRVAYHDIVNLVENFEVGTVLKYTNRGAVAVEPQPVGTAPATKDAR